MTPMLGVVIYLVVAIVTGFSVYSYMQYKFSNDLTVLRPDQSLAFALGSIWLFSIIPMLIVLVTDGPRSLKRVKEKKAEIAARQDRLLQIENRKRIIEEINADTDRFEQTRREDVMSGREIVDIREGEARNLCYICNQTRSPYVRRRAYYELDSYYKGTLINTISNVPAHEECIMGELNLRE